MTPRRPYEPELRTIPLTPNSCDLKTINYNPNSDMEWVGCKERVGACAYIIFLKRCPRGFP